MTIFVGTFTRQQKKNGTHFLLCQSPEVPSNKTLPFNLSCSSHSIKSGRWSCSHLFLYPMSVKTGTIFSNGIGLASVYIRKNHKTALLYIATTHQPSRPSFAVQCHEQQTRSPQRSLLRRKTRPRFYSLHY